MSCIGMLYCKGTSTLAVLLLLYPCIHAKMLYKNKKKREREGVCDGWTEDLTCMSDGVSGMQNLNQLVWTPCSV